MMSNIIRGVLLVKEYASVISGQILPDETIQLFYNAYESAIQHNGSKYYGGHINSDGMLDTDGHVIMTNIALSEGNLTCDIEFPDGCTIPSDAIFFPIITPVTSNNDSDDSQSLESVVAQPLGWICTHE
jgi:hypothetical protein